MGRSADIEENRSYGPRLAAAWFDRPTAGVARDLLGRVLVRSREARVMAVRIVETEAYVGGDPASHACAGRTRRNRSMFATPATLYVYRIHQVYCANVVTRAGEAVLLRAGEALTPGLGGMNGPGRLCRVLGITTDQDGWSLASGEIQIRAGAPPISGVVSGPRVGIRKAARRRLRFAVNGSRAVSLPRPPGWRPSKLSP